MIARMIHENPADNATPCGTNPTLSSPIAPDGTPEIGRRYTIPARQGRAMRLAEGQSIRIINTHGTQVCDTGRSMRRTAPSTCLGRTRAWINRAAGSGRRAGHQPPPADPHPDRGHVASVHDTLIAACDLFRYMTLGERVSRQLRRQPAHGHDGDRPDRARGAQPFNVWMNIPLAADWTIDWLPPVASPAIASHCGPRWTASW